MRINCEIPNDKVANFSSGALNELKTQASKIIGDIADEAGRIETARRSSDTTSEVTQSDVKFAANQPRMSFPRKKGIMMKLIQLVASLSSLFMGSLLDFDKFNNSNHVIVFLIITFIAFGTTIYSTFNQDGHGQY